MLKLLVIQNNTKFKIIQKYLDYFPVDFEVEYIETTFPVELKQYDGSDQGRWGVHEAIKDVIRPVVARNTYHAVIFIYPYKSEYRGKDLRFWTNWNPLHPETEFIQCFTDNTLSNDWISQTINHELFHTFFYNLGRKFIFLEDPMDNVTIDGHVYQYYNDYSLTVVPSNRSIALERLTPYWDTIQNKHMYKYFNPTQDPKMVGLQPVLLEKLDLAREFSQTPFVIVSGLRDEAKNDEVGGVPDSAHLRGLAVDLACSTSNKRWKMINGALKAGFKRIGIGKDFIHLDCDPDKPQEHVWTYYH